MEENINNLESNNYNNNLLDNDPKNFKLKFKDSFFLILIVVIVFIGGFLLIKILSKDNFLTEQKEKFILKKDEQKLKEKNQQNFNSLKTKSLDNKNNSKITIATDKKKYQLGEEIVIKVSADSQQKSIAAYDILLGFDKNTFELINVEDLSNSFDIFKFTAKNHLTITAAKKISINNPIIFSNNEILTLKLKSLKKGIFSIKILPTTSQEKTQLVDNSSKVYYPDSNEISVEIY